MATKIRIPVSAAEIEAQHTISTAPIFMYRSLFAFRRAVGEQIFELTESIKPAINIKLDAYGNPNVSTINMGVQYEHYST